LNFEVNAKDYKNVFEKTEYQEAKKKLNLKEKEEIDSQDGNE